MGSSWARNTALPDFLALLPKINKDLTGIQLDSIFSHLLDRPVGIKQVKQNSWEEIN